MDYEIMTLEAFVSSDFKQLDHSIKGRSGKKEPVVRNLARSFQESLLLPSQALYFSFTF